MWLPAQAAGGPTVNLPSFTLPQPLPEDRSIRSLNEGPGARRRSSAKTC